MVRQLTATWVVWAINEEVRSGSLSPALLRPIGPLWVHAARNLAALPFRGLVLVPLVVVIAWWRPGMLAAPAGAPGAAIAPLVAVSSL